MKKSKSVTGNFMDLFDRKPGLKEALCAIGYFRGRHEMKGAYAAARTRRGKSQTVSVYPESVRMARKYIRRARAEGWRGSIVAAVFSASKE